MKASVSSRAGEIIFQATGYPAFIPKPLPPNPPLKMDQEMLTLLSEADRKLGRLDGSTDMLPNPDLFVMNYVRKEALLSSQIEGTQASFIDIAENCDPDETTSDVQDVCNYVNAMNYGLERLKTFPMSLRLIREIHKRLLENGRGKEKSPGDFRSSQNWIGSSGCGLERAIFIPPPPEAMQQALYDLEKFFYVDTDINTDNIFLPPLIKIALIHAQFETIHPFLDGNGRVGRLLITFWLCQQEILSRPLLYLSYFFKQNRTEYYDRLMAVRMKGDWEGWVKFFLRGVAEVSSEATRSAREIIALKTKCTEQIVQNKKQRNGIKLLDLFFERILLSSKKTADLLDVSLPTAINALESMAATGIIDRLNPTKKRNRIYIFNHYLDILSRGTEPTSGDN